MRRRYSKAAVHRFDRWDARGLAPRRYEDRAPGRLHSVWCLGASPTYGAAKLRKQSRGGRSGLRHLASLEGASPLEHLVRVHSVRPRHQRHACAWLQRQLYDPPLLCNRSPPANTTFRPRSLCLHHDAIVRLNFDSVPEGKTGRLLAKHGATWRANKRWSTGLRRGAEACG